MGREISHDVEYFAFLAQIGQETTRIMRIMRTLCGLMTDLSLGLLLVEFGLQLDDLIAVLGGFEEVHAFGCCHHLALEACNGFF